MQKLTFLVCLLIAHCSYSQATYPKQTVLDGDTLVLITLDQIKTINYNFLSLEECRSLSVSYLKQIENYKNKLDKRTHLELNLRSQVVNSKSIVKDLEESVDILDKNVGKLEKRLRLTKTTRVIYTSIGFIGGAYIGSRINIIGTR
jgi:hypothetical protein